MAQSKSTKVELTCQHCGRTYFVTTRRAGKSRFCSAPCYHKSRQRFPVIHPDGTATIQLTRGLVAVIDAADAELVSGYTWYASEHRPGHFYAKANTGDGTLAYLHRLITGAPDGIDVDHIDGDGLNDRHSNLRFATRSENMANTTMRRDNSSGFKGVSRNKRGWAACIKVNGQRVHLGTFPSPEDAALVYDEAAILHFGEYARTNFSI